MGAKSLFGLVDNLEFCLKNLKWKAKGTEWMDYYNENEHALEFLKKVKL